jgi:hypothetical protein
VVRAGASGRAAVRLALGFALALGGCGGGGGGSGDARSAAQSYLKAFASGDAAKACALLTPAGRAGFVARVRAVAAAVPDCPAAVGKLRAAAGPAAMRALGTATVSEPKVSGNRATVTLTSGAGSRPARLVRRGGRWLLAAVPGIQ